MIRPDPSAFTTGYCASNYHRALHVVVSPRAPGGLASSEAVRPALFSSHIQPGEAPPPHPTNRDAQVHCSCPLSLAHSQTMLLAPDASRRLFNGLEVFPSSPPVARLVGCVGHMCPGPVHRRVRSERQRHGPLTALEWAVGWIHTPDSGRGPAAAGCQPLLHGRGGRLRRAGAGPQQAHRKGAPLPHRQALASRKLLAKNAFQLIRRRIRRESPASSPLRCCPAARHLPAASNLRLGLSTLGW